MSSFARLKWQCRRGTKELDYLLESYLLKHYQQMDKDELALFVELLNLQDSQLILFLLGDQLPDSTALTNLVQKIRNPENI
ncbi:MAG: succinate dehydrogenase assembly factor 2 [Methylococcales bacterium]|nr:succinate dehydrogenase assembly factor 2 [Methylococcales bacterium]